MRPRLREDQIVMRRATLEGLAAPVVPPPYALRTFRPGDEAGWLALMAAAFPTSDWSPDRLRREFLDHPSWRMDRIFFICHEDRPVACAAAWRGDWCGPRTGMVHWVATHPDHRRRGLARAAVLAALAWMRERGYRDASLITENFRLAAVRLYLALGFRPDLSAASDMRTRWDAVQAMLREAGGGAPAGASEGDGPPR